MKNRLYKTRILKDEKILVLLIITQDKERAHAFLEEMYGPEVNFFMDSSTKIHQIPNIKTDAEEIILELFFIDDPKALLEMYEEMIIIYRKKLLI